MVDGYAVREMLAHIGVHRGTEKIQRVRDAAAEGDVAGIIRIQDVADELAEVHAELLEEGEGRGVAVPGGNGRRLAVPSPAFPGVNVSKLRGID